MRDAIIEVLDSGHWWQSGNGRAERLEGWITDFHACLGTVAVTNGTHALELALRALSIGAGDDVLVPAISFISTATAVSFVGARPVAVDVCPDSLCIDPEDLRRKLTPRSRAVIVVQLGGIPADMTAITEVAARASLAVVEDCAQGLGARWAGRPVGAIGAMGTFSFQAAKLLAGGEGGAVTVRDDPGLLERTALLANCGRPRGSRTYDHVLIGSNFRMSEFHAALLLTQIASLGQLQARRESAAASLAAALSASGLGTPVTSRDPRAEPAWYTFGIRMLAEVTSQMAIGEVARGLEARGIPASPLYRPFYATPAYRDGGANGEAGCPNADRAAQEVILLHHRLLLGGQAGVEAILEALHGIVRSPHGR
jgi:3-amino-5-hydroxybenzoate synthase